MSDGLFIDDGCTLTRTIPAVAGLHPDLRVSYRPALRREQITYRQVFGSGDPQTIDEYEVKTIAKYGVTVNGESLKSPERVAKLKPAIRVYLIDLIMGYSPADQERDAGNSPQG